MLTLILFALFAAGSTLLWFAHEGSTGTPHVFSIGSGIFALIGCWAQAAHVAHLL